MIPKIHELDRPIRPHRTIRHGEAAGDLRAILVDMIIGACLVLSGLWYVVGSWDIPMPWFEYIRPYRIELYILVLFGIGSGMYFLLRGILYFPKAMRVHYQGEETTGTIQRKWYEKIIEIDGDHREKEITIYYAEFEFLISSTKFVIKQKICQARFEKLLVGSTIRVRYVPEYPLIARMDF